MANPNLTQTPAPAQAPTPTRRKWGARTPRRADVAMMAEAQSGTCAKCGRTTLLGGNNLCLGCAMGYEPVPASTPTHQAPRPTATPDCRVCGCTLANHDAVTCAWVGERKAKQAARGRSAWIEEV